MKELVFAKGYQENELLRKSFNELASSIFGIDFEVWYQHGFWTEKYIPYSYIEYGRVVANVSVNLVDLIIDNEKKQSVQIGTVMTHPDYRNQGLSKKLMDQVLEDYKDIDLMYLFANQSVLDFYPKFGFKEYEELQFSMDRSFEAKDETGIRKLNGRNVADLAFIYRLAADRLSGSAAFGTHGTEELLMFYCLMVFNQDLYYAQDEQAVVIMQHEEDTLHLYDVISKEKVELITILRKLVNKNTAKIVFHFQPEDVVLPLKTKVDKSSNVLFIKNLTGVSLPNGFKHPLTSQA